MAKFRPRIYALVYMHSQTRLQVTAVICRVCIRREWAMHVDAGCVLMASHARLLGLAREHVHLPMMEDEPGDFFPLLIDG